MKIKFLKFICAIFLLSGCGPSKEELKLTEELKTKTSEVSNLTQSLITAKAEYVKLSELSQSEISKIGEQLRITTSESEKVINQFKSATTDNALLAEKLKLLTSENSQLTDQLKLAKASLTDMSDKIQKLEKELNSIIIAKKQEDVELLNKVKIVLQAGVTMNSGDTKPVSNVEVFITEKSLEEIMPFRNLNYDGVKMRGFKEKIYSTSKAWACGLGEYGILCGTILNQIESSLNLAKITSNTTDFNGVVEFTDLKPGIYFIHCATSLGGGVAWSLKVEIKPGQNKLFMSNKNISGAASYY